MFRWRTRQSAAAPALWFKRENRYQSIPWTEFADFVQLTCLALYALGIGKGDRVGILSENRPEWAFADLGILSLGAASVPVYPTSSIKETQYILEHAEVRFLFVSTPEQFEKVRSLLDEGRLKAVIGFNLNGRDTSKIIDYSDFLESGRRLSLNNCQLYDQLISGITREDLSTVIYTSGTTGPPKGVMLSHGNFLSNCEAASKVLTLGRGERSLSFLPLSHVFERMAGYYFMILEGVSIAYAESMQTVPEDLLLVRPTVAASVPRLYEKMHARIMETLQALSPVKQKIFRWALKIGDQISVLRQSKKPIGLTLQLRFALARLLVFKKLREHLGGRIRFFISGGAPLAKELAEFFFAADVLILEGYGLTETSPVITVNRPDRFKFGTVGTALPGVEIKIAPDGEILSRGPHIMQGYYKNEEATHEAIRDGWFYTGDLGEIDSEGFLKITGRKKDLIITAGGKNISPQNIESEILSDPVFSQVVVIGDRRPYLVALIVPNRQELQRIADQMGIVSLGGDLFHNQAILEKISIRLNLKMKDFAPYEQIKYFHLLENEMTQATGELTPTLKIKRRVISEQYNREIEALYRQGEGHQVLTHGH